MEKTEELIDVTEDGKIKKIILQKGFGPSPKPGEIANIRYKIFLEDGTLIKEDDTEIEVGRAALKGLDIAIQNIKRIEKSKYFIPAELAYGETGNENLKILPNTNIVLELYFIKIVEKPIKNNKPVQKKTDDNELADSDKKEVEEPFEEKIKRAQIYKEQGVKYFNEKMIQEAAGTFKQGMDILYGQALNDQGRVVILSLCLNLCNCLNMLGYYQNTIDTIGFAFRLKKDHPKVYYYRGMAYAHLDKLEDAENDLNKLKELVANSDPAVLSLKSLIDGKTVKPDTKIFKSMMRQTEPIYEKDPYKKEKKKNSDDDSDSSEDYDSTNRVKLFG